MDPVPVYALNQTVWLWTQVDGSSATYWTQGVVTFVYRAADRADVPSTNPTNLHAARNLSYSIAFQDRYNRRSSTTVGPAMLRPRRGLLPSEDGL
ncbi:hypothetical protein BKA62DRAFT_822446 [Auriculariales sp. MPI-PUGE-AT-0066]|nr:hypothetical protein BKA62DRAFT_822446 [Auriculariales sp. MPI-PUGE-AT-0066]